MAKLDILGITLVLNLGWEALAWLGILGIALALDLVLGEPPNALHPVAWLGKLVCLLEEFAPRGKGLQLAYGLLIVLLGVTLFTLPAWFLLSYLGQRSPLAYLLLGGILLKPSFALRGLFQSALKVKEALREGRLVEARARLRVLVSRETERLSPALVVSATVESVAENACDSFLAPLLYYLSFGVPGALAYRAINTLDAMIGYHGRYEYLGKASARLDDLANLIPARFTAMALMAAAAMGRGDVFGAWGALRYFRYDTESPNAGWPMGAMAGALGVQLVKPCHYCLGEARVPLLPLKIDQCLSLTGVALLLGLAVYLFLWVGARYVYIA